MKSKYLKWRALPASIAASTLIFSAVANAQNAQLEEIVVTALKRETALEDTPLAVSVMTGDYIKTAGVKDLTDLQQITPSLHMDESDFGVNINLRGVTTTDNTSKGDQGVGFNIDGVTIGRPREMAVAFMDVERVEVLRGPQGTLYGKSTTGGVINVISKRPDPNAEFGGDATMEVGSYSAQRLSGAVNIPVNEDFALRFAAANNSRSGYWGPLANSPDPYSPARGDEDNQSYRLSGLWNINDNHSFYTNFTSSQLRGVGGGGIPQGIFFSGGRAVYGVPSAITPATNENFHSFTLEYKGVFGGVEATYLGGLRGYDANSFTAGSDAPSPGWNWGQYRGTGDTESHELRLSNAEPGAINWVVGYNDFSEELTESDHRWNLPDDNQVREASSPGIDPLNATNHYSSGFFGQVDWGISDSLNLTLGARRSKDEVSRRGTFAVGPGQVDADGNACVWPADCIGGRNDADQSASKTTWRLGFDYSLGDNGLVYASGATGYKAGGFNDFDPTTGQPGAYEPEELIAYEFGYKGEILESLQWNTSLYMYDYEKAQVSNAEPVGGNFVLFTASIPSEIKGWENELVWTPTDQDRLNISFTTSDGEFKNFDNPPSYLDGTTWTLLGTNNVPVNKLSDFVLSVDWSHDFLLDSGAMLTARLYSRYDSGYFLSNYPDAARGTLFEVDSFTRTDANLTYTSADGRYTIGAYIKNIENDLQPADTPGDVTNLNSLEDSVSVNAPTTYGVRIGVEF